VLSLCINDKTIKSDWAIQFSLKTVDFRHYVATFL